MKVLRPPRKAVFLDRDGTLIKIIHRPNLSKKYTAPFSFHELEFEESVEAFMEKLKLLGFLRIIITNQPDVAIGYMIEAEWWKIHNKVMEVLRPDDFFTCRHRHEDKCPFKKPMPFMLLAAVDKWDIDLSESFMVGDTDNDTEAGKAAGCRTIILRRPYNEGVKADFEAADLAGVLQIIESGQ